MLGHELRDGEVPVQFVGDKLTVTKRFLKAFLFHLPIAGPASECPGHQKGQAKNKENANPVGHKPGSRENR